MIADDRSGTIDNIMCNIHKKQIIGLRLQQKEKYKMNCLDCIQQQNNASNLTDPLTFLEQLSLKRQQLVQIADQWKKLSTNFLEIIQTEIKKFPVKITNYIELEQGIELYTSGIFSFEQLQNNIDQFFKGLTNLHRDYQNGYNLTKAENVPKIEIIEQPFNYPPFNLILQSASFYNSNPNQQDVSESNSRKPSPSQQFQKLNQKKVPVNNYKKPNQFYQIQPLPEELQYKQPNPDCQVQ